MEETLNALSGLLLKALPTFFLLVVLHFYFKKMFFQPMDKVLRDRDEAIQGLRKVAQDEEARTAQLMAEFESGLTAARGEIYREQDAARRTWQKEKAAAVQESRAHARATVESAKAQLRGEAVEAKEKLASESDRLAVRIAGAILKGRRN